MLGIGALGRGRGDSGIGGWGRVMGVVGLVLELSACAIDERTVETIDTVAASGAAGAGDIGVGADAGTLNGSIGGAGNSGRPVPDQLDLLFMIDNSISMSDKQEILRLAVSDLMDRLVNPVCLDADGTEQPAPPPGVDCPEGQRRQFSPINDIHVGVVSSSLGDIGAEVACPTALGNQQYIPDRVDMAHLVGSLARGSEIGANAQGFLQWRQGEDLAEFNAAFQRMVTAVGDDGCGWEASLESWYRFLVDPQPYASLSRVPCAGAEPTTSGCVAVSVDENDQPHVDQPLLAQRAAFLRPDSLVVVVMLTDENDCSLQPDSQNWVVAAINDSRPMIRGTSVCDADPNHECCHSCASAPPEGCAYDPVCDGDATANVLPNRLPVIADGLNLRCLEQKRRFGDDFLYPTRRYVNALTQPTLCLEQAALSVEGCVSAPVPNPLFVDGRTPDQVFLAAILGVPWQSIASGLDRTGRPLPDPGRQLRFKSSSELTDSDWARIAGSPGTPWRAATADSPEVASTPPIPPSEPTMVESRGARSNVTSGNPINGREYDTSIPDDIPDDLQYACIFPLPTPRDCAEVVLGLGGCDCFADEVDKPLCEATPGNGSPSTVQYWAKAYPGLRPLQVLRELGDASIVSSICARNVTNAERPDFGYRPAMSAIVERLQTQLGPGTDG
jgi:hypothetical protein